MRTNKHWQLNEWNVVADLSWASKDRSHTALWNVVWAKLHICTWTKIELFWNICLPISSANQNPKPELVLLLLLLPFSSPLSRFLHWLQTSITQSFVKLEHFLRPFLKTRSHDGSAHTFRSSLWLLEVPQKGVKKIIFWHFLTTFFGTFGLREGLKKIKKLAFDKLDRTPPPPSPQVGSRNF